MKYKNILQIDDDYDNCEFFEQALKTVSDAMYTCIQDPIEALQKLINNEISPDIIFLDVNMPTMSGPELLGEIKKRQLLKGIPIILLSTSPMYSHTINAFSGAEDYLIKPDSFTELKNLILKVIT